MNKSRLIRVPLSMFNEIKRIKNQLQKESRKPVTLTKAAGEYHRNKNRSFFGGKLL